jgi:hypothetical protein
VDELAHILTDGWAYSAAGSIGLACFGDPSAVTRGMADQGDGGFGQACRYAMFGNTQLPHSFGPMLLVSIALRAWVQADGAGQSWLSPPMSTPKIQHWPKNWSSSSSDLPQSAR